MGMSFYRFPFGRSHLSGATTCYIRCSFHLISEESPLGRPKPGGVGSSELRQADAQEIGLVAHKYIQIAQAHHFAVKLSMYALKAPA